MSKQRSISPTSPSSAAAPSEGAKQLQDKLHLLLNKLAQSMKIINEWPDEDGDDSTPHTETTQNLTNSVLDVVEALKAVEGVIKTDSILRKSLQECQVPVNLLDLLDHGSGLNPDCFSRGLLREALGQLAGLRRRKKALEMLGAAIQKGLDYKDAQQQQQDKVGGTYVDVKEEEQQPAISQKRKSDDEPGDGSAAEADTDGSIHPPPAKKVKT